MAKSAPAPDHGNCMRRVVVTGIGLITPLGCGAKVSWERLINAHSGISAIQSWNNLSNPRDLMAGQSLLIWVPKDVASRQNGNQAASGKNVLDYTIRRGDTLWDIARQFNVTVSSIQAGNNLSRRSRIYPGDKIRIVLPD